MSETKETKETKKPTYDFRKLTAKDMAEYIEKHHNNAESKKAFKEAAFELKAEKVAVTVYEADGKPKYYVDKSGKTRVKKKMIDANTGKRTYKFNLLKAKNYFYDEYKDEIDFKNAPKSKTESNKKSEIETLFGNW
jgi:hypothetical protein